MARLFNIHISQAQRWTAICLSAFKSFAWNQIVLNAFLICFPPIRCFRLLATFAKQYKQQSLDVYYVLNGYKHTEGDEVKIQRFMLVEEDDVEEEKRYFTEITGCMIKAVQIKSEDELETFIAPESDKFDLAKQIEKSVVYI